MKKTIILLLAAFMLLWAAPPARAEEAYTDVAGHWAEKAILTWSSRGVIEGFEGLFRPDDGITRGEMAAILDRVIVYTDMAANSFSDLDEEAWYTPYVLKLNAAGVMLGDGVGMRPLDGITRQEAMVMICRALGLDSSFPPEYSLPYADSAEVAPWAYPAVVSLDAAGDITDSAAGFLRPAAFITRAEVVTLLDNIVQLLLANNGLFNERVEGDVLITGQRVMLINSAISGNIYIAGGGTALVILENTVVGGEVINLSQAELRLYDQTVINNDQLLFGDYVLPVQPTVNKNKLAAADFSYSGPRLTYSGPGGAAAGVDISEWQEDINWQAVAADGIEYAIIRIGYRGSTEGKLTEDLYYSRNIREAKAAGLKVGVYFFSQAVNETEARDEAQYVLWLLGGEKLDFPVFFDWEFTSGEDSRVKNMDGATLTSCARVFCDVIAERGYQPGLYIYGNPAYLYYDLSRFTDVDWWFAGYFDTPEFYYSFRIWQYTSSGSVAGIKGRADMNLLFSDY